MPLLKRPGASSSSSSVGKGGSAAGAAAGGGAAGTGGSGGAGGGGGGALESDSVRTAAATTGLAAHAGDEVRIESWVAAEGGKAAAASLKMAEARYAKGVAGAVACEAMADVVAAQGAELKAAVAEVPASSAASSASASASSSGSKKSKKSSRSSKKERRSSRSAGAGADDGDRFAEADTALEERLQKVMLASGDGLETVGELVRGLSGARSDLDSAVARDFTGPLRSSVRVDLTTAAEAQKRVDRAAKAHAAAEKTLSKAMAAKDINLARVGELEQARDWAKAELDTARTEALTVLTATNTRLDAEALVRSANLLEAHEQFFEDALEVILATQPQMDRLRQVLAEAEASALQDDLRKAAIGPA